MLLVAPCWSDTYSISCTYRRHLAFLVYTSWTFRFTTCFNQDSEPVLSSLIFVSTWTPNQLSPCRCNRAVHLRIAKQASHGAELWSRMEVLHDGKETKEICVSNILESLSIPVFKSLKSCLSWALGWHIRDHWASYIWQLLRFPRPFIFRPRTSSCPEWLRSWLLPLFCSLSSILHWCLKEH